MTDRKPEARSRTLARRLLALDAWIDTAAYATGRRLAGVWSRYQEALGRFRVRGAARVAAEVASEAATLGTVAAVVLLAFAVPAFKATEGDWRAKGEYAVTFLDRNGNQIGRRGLFLDDTVPLDEFPDSLIKATLATEDRRFFDHFGIDIVGTLRALTQNLRANGVVQGGSSITQQLAKNLFLSNERTIERKIREAYLALWLEANLTKQEILKLYLDRAYMGGGSYGAAAAAKFYFGKSVRDLTLAESALLAGLYKAPARYAPHVNLAAARTRTNQVLTNLVDAGFMTDGQVAAARRRPAEIVSMSREAAPDWFLDWAFEEVKRIAPKESHTLNVRTTLDPEVQRAAEAAIETNLRQHGPQYRVTQAATVVQEPDGAVRGMVGGRDYGTSQFNRAVYALRQPGSSFKTFVYAAAFLNGYTSKSVVPDAPITIGNWSPRNYGRSYAGAVTLKTALTKSINTVPVRLAQAIGRGAIVETAHRMGLRSELKITRALPLGVAEVTVLDMTGAYASLASGGLAATPFAIDEIRATTDDRLLYAHRTDEPAPERVLPVEVAEQLNDILANVVTAGTGRRALLDGIPAAGKTGTTQAYRDAWFAGFTGNYVAAVWYGNDDFTSTKDMTGGSLPAQTWKDIMARIHVGAPLKPIPGVAPPDALVAAAPAPTPETAVPAVSRDRLTEGGADVVGEIASLIRLRRATGQIGFEAQQHAPVPPAGSLAAVASADAAVDAPAPVVRVLSTARREPASHSGASISTPLPTVLEAPPPPPVPATAPPATRVQGPLPARLTAGQSPFGPAARVNGFEVLAPPPARSPSFIELVP
ncbi:transglycosylase domain-containing protein [Methylobrevis albus]|uniref:PBP1A family penicillin-binding protein n=1 Tax=Methylobrevis albus TaxID=2793297 RepID=A0A931MYX4_9HYPH|nr:PBP1A family penicillin-binding protein [Methylobrevis albus]MBH0237176.1 PBP1A family penicillin-binding protein [Methylobrevis albus]